MSNNSFKTKFDFETRKKESDKIKLKYPNRYPIIINKTKKCLLPEIEKTKFLIPGDLTMGQFMFVIRKRIKLEDKDSLFFFINDNTIPLTSSLISTIYEDHKDEDGFLYVSYCNENVFG
jgi:GABA(A) receptor-associated protein